MAGSGVGVVFVLGFVGCVGLGFVLFGAWIDPLMVLSGWGSRLGVSLSIFSKKFSISFCKSVMPVKIGFSWVDSVGEGKKLESLRNSFLVRGSSTTKLRHSSFLASSSSLQTSLSRYWTWPRLSKWWSCSAHSELLGRLKRAMSSLARLPTASANASASASSYSSISWSGPYGSVTLNWIGARCGMVRLGV